MHNPVRWNDPSGLFAIPMNFNMNINLTGKFTAMLGAMAMQPSQPYIPTMDDWGGSFLTPNEIAAGVTKININGVYFRDLSVPVNAMLTSNANEARVRREGVPISVPIMPSLFFKADTAYIYSWILDNFAAGRRWDFKDADSWSNEFPGFNFDRYGQFVVNGVLMRPADLGNVNFGYVTSALGVPTPIQLVGAGVAHIRDHGFNTAYFRNFGDSDICRYFTDMGRSWYRYGRPKGVNNGKGR